MVLPCSVPAGRVTNVVMSTGTPGRVAAHAHAVGDGERHVPTELPIRGRVDGSGRLLTDPPPAGGVGRVVGHGHGDHALAVGDGAEVAGRPVAGGVAVPVEEH